MPVMPESYKNKTRYVWERRVKMSPSTGIGMYHFIGHVPAFDSENITEQITFGSDCCLKRK